MAPTWWCWVGLGWGGGSLFYPPQAPSLGAGRAPRSVRAGEEAKAKLAAAASLEKSPPWDYLGLEWEGGYGAGTPPHASPGAGTGRGDP